MITDSEVKGQYDPSQLAADIIEKINEGFVALDAQMNYLYINRRGSELLKRKPEDMIGKNYWEEYPEDKDTSFGKAYRKALETQAIIYLEDYYASRDLWFENRIYPSENGLSIFSTISQSVSELNKPKLMWNRNSVSGQASPCQVSRDLYGCAMVRRLSQQ
jgi:PAS domain-containing protein